MNLQRQLMLTGATIAVVLTQVVAPTASAGVCGTLKTCLDGDAVYTGLSEGATRALPKAPASAGGAKGAAGTSAAARPTYEYVMTLACPTNDPLSGEGNGCFAAYETCKSVNANGPYTRIYRRVLTPPPTGAGAPTPGRWEMVGYTCWPDLVPGTTARPRLTLAMITAQWRRTPFAKPQISSQPVGGKTLVNLETYFQLNWPNAGYQPEEIDTVTMLGHQVRIKPTLKANRFEFGDGTSTTTTSTGGDYPDGDVRHTYKHAGSLQVSVATVYGGQYSIDGSAWTDIPDTIRVPGPTAGLQVVTAQDQLVNH